MSSDIEIGIAEMFRDAVKQNIVMELRTQADWDRFKEIDEAARAQTAEENRAFQHDRSQRLVEARKEIIDRAGAITHDHPTPFGTDKFDKAAIDRQANRKVDADHQRCLLAIQQREADSYVALREDIHTREGIRDQARDAFTRSVDRRNGDDRRMPSRDR